MDRHSLWFLLVFSWTDTRAQLYSMGQVDLLTQRAELQQKLTRTDKRDVDLEDLFAEEDDDFSFNF